MTHPIGGVNAAAATPVTADGRPDHALFTAHCRALIDEGCHGIAMLGTTGEANSIGLRDRMALLEAALAAGIPGEALLPGTSTPAADDAIELTRHAVKAGVKGCLVLPPYYYKSPSEEGLFRFYARLIEGVGDDALRLVLYHIPQISMIPIPHDLIERLMAEFPGIVVAIKDSSGDFENMKAMAHRFPELGVITGADPLLWPLLKEGGAGCITGAANLCATLLREMWDSWEDPDNESELEILQERIVAWRTLSNRFVQLSTVKAMVARRRGSDGWFNMLPPFVETTPEVRAAIYAEMAELEG